MTTYPLSLLDLVQAIDEATFDVCGRHPLSDRASLRDLDRLSAQGAIRIEISLSDELADCTDLPRFARAVAERSRGRQLIGATVGGRDVPVNDIDYGDQFPVF